MNALCQYACVSERTIREWIHLPLLPLPAVQVARGKLLIKRNTFDAWLEAHPYQPIESIDVDQLTSEIMSQFRKAA